MCGNGEVPNIVMTGGAVIGLLVLAMVGWRITCEVLDYLRDRRKERDQ